MAQALGPLQSVAFLLSLMPISSNNNPISSNNNSFSDDSQWCDVSAAYL